jgi:hypothetical protein
LFGRVAKSPGRSIQEVRPDNLDLPFEHLNDGESQLLSYPDGVLYSELSAEQGNADS